MKTLKIFLILITFSFLMNILLAAKDKIEVYIVTTDYLNLREAASINSKVVTVSQTDKTKVQLRIGNTVRVIKQTDEEEIVNGKKGRWAYVDPGFADHSCAWVFDYFLADKNDFKPLNSLPNNYILKFSDGDAPFIYEFYKDGTAIYKAIDEDEKDQKGKLYIDSRNKVITIKYDDDKDDFEIYMMMRTFFFKGDKLCVVGGGDLSKDGTYDACAIIKK